MARVHKGVNWNIREDSYSEMFWDQNIRQFWIEKEIDVASDSKSWRLLSKEEQDVYKKVLAGLTLLDTKQGGDGMPLILLHTEKLQAKSVLAFMGGMEEVHAKSYSRIFTTLLPKEEIEDLFLWIEENKYLQHKANIVINNYHKIFKPEINIKDLYMAMVTSVFLESFLFYSGFFYPLFLAGQGKLTKSGEIINLIIRDESIHGVLVGLLAQEIFEQLPDNEKEQTKKEVHALLEELMDNEYAYTEELYSQIDMDSEVKRFLRYNANKALNNLGIDAYYELEEVNPIVLAGLNTETKTHDFFSMKGNGYQKGITSPILDEHFNHNIEDEFIVD